MAEDLPLPRESGPRGLLSEAARRRLWNVHAEADLIRKRALAAVEARYRNEAHSGKTFHEYLGSGQAVTDLAEANVQAARVSII